MQIRHTRNEKSAAIDMKLETQNSYDGSVCGNPKREYVLAVL